MTKQHSMFLLTHLVLDDEILNFMFILILWIKNIGSSKSLNLTFFEKRELSLPLVTFKFIAITSCTCHTTKISSTHKFLY